MQNVIIYKEPGRYAAWPANYGIWNWGNEIVTGFFLGRHQADGTFHARSREHPTVPMQARSLDGGFTWRVEDAPARTPGGRGFSADEHMRSDLTVKHAIELGLEYTPAPCPGGIDFTHPDFALLCARTGLGGGSVPWFYHSYDRCRTWEGPWALPMFGQTGIEARTDYIVDGPGACTLFLTAAGPGGGEGAGVLCARTTDSGATFELVGWVARVHDEGYVIMPSSVRLPGGRLLCAVRRREGGKNFRDALYCIDLYASDDNGATWDYVTRPVPNTGMGGNPPALLKLADERLCLVYGYRDAPYGLRARLSTDGEATWADERVLRDDGGSHDLGYPRVVQRPDDTLVAVYYFNDRLGGEAYIAASLWRP